MRKLILGFIGLLILLFLLLLLNTLTLKSKQLSGAGKGKLIELPVDLAAVQHLSEAIKIQTISFDDTVKTTDNSHFDSLIGFLRQTYPNVFAVLKDTLIGGKNLILKWEGTKPDLLPAILYAHMDVVPVEQNTLNEWKHDAFGGDVADGFIWGRGAVDDKGSLISIFEAINRLIIKGLKPTRTIYIASGADEEIGGNHGAKLIAQYFREANTHFAFYLDEGLSVVQGMVPNIKQDVALIGTAEKGYVTLELTVNLPGGHSSRPAKETAIDVLANALKKVHDNPFEKHTTEPIDEFLDYIGPEVAMPMKLVFANRWLFKPLILKEYEKTGEGNAMIRTTGVATVISGGIKENLIPTKVSAKINFRILPGETVEQVEEHVRKAIGDDRVKIQAGERYQPSKVSSASSWGFKLLQATASKTFPDALVSPFLMIGSTDSKHFADLSDGIYRFFPTRMNKDAIAGFHGINEKIRIPYYMETIHFYEQLMDDMQTFSDESRK